MSFPLFFDEDQNDRIATRLARSGIDVLTTRGAGRHNWRLSDEDQFAFAATGNRALVTNNAVDFYNIFRSWWTGKRHHSGIIVVSPWKTPSEIYEALLRLQEMYPDGIDDLILPV